MPRTRTAKTNLKTNRDMAYLTENKLSNLVELPIALPATTLKQGDWVVVATVKLVSPQRLSLRALTMQLLEATVDIGDIVTGNKVVPNLGLAYYVLRKDYVSGSPGGAGALDYLKLDGVGAVARSTVPAVFVGPGNYSVIIANNMQTSTESTITEDIDFKVLMTGQFRLELSTT
jgi:hypothetical protein